MGGSSKDEVTGERDVIRLCSTVNQLGGREKFTKCVNYTFAATESS